MTALNGLLVVELCGERGQYMGKLMGDMGARVVKIEPLLGSPERNIGPFKNDVPHPCLLYTSPSPRDLSTSRMPSSA